VKDAGNGAVGGRREAKGLGATQVSRRFHRDDEGPAAGVLEARCANPRHRMPSGSSYTGLFSSLDFLLGWSARDWR